MNMKNALLYAQKHISETIFRIKQIDEVTYLLQDDTNYYFIDNNYNVIDDSSKLKNKDIFRTVLRSAS